MDRKSLPARYHRSPKTVPQSGLTHESRQQSVGMEYHGLAGVSFPCLIDGRNTTLNHWLQDILDR